MPIQISSSDVYLSPLQAYLMGGSGTVSLDLELSKPYTVSTVATDAIEHSWAQDRVWLEYAFRKLHMVLQYLPTKVTESVWVNRWKYAGRAWISLPHQVECIRAEWHSIQASGNLTETAAHCTLSVALNGSQSSAEEWCRPAVTPLTCQKVGFTWIPDNADICSVRRILCSQCPHIRLSWTTQRTSLLKSVGLPCPQCPALLHLLCETQGWQVAIK